MEIWISHLYFVDNMLKAKKQSKEDELYDEIVDLIKNVTNK